jgi:protein farnesyltransferase subunit beta
MAQDPGAGGLRDKPGKRTDVYHSFYALAGLSTAQHRVYQSQKKLDKLFGEWKDSPGLVPSTAEGKENKYSETEEERNLRRKTTWARSRSWKEDENVKKYVGGSKNGLVCPSFKLWKPYTYHSFCH